MKTRKILYLIFWVLMFPVSGRAFETGDLFLEKERASLEEKGLMFEAAYIGDFVSVMKGGIHDRTTYLGNLDFGITYDLGRAGILPGGRIYVSGNHTHGGEKPTAQYIGDWQGVDNIEVRDAMRLYEWWYEQNFFEDKISFLAGVEGLDSEFALTQYGALFINSSFGTPPDLSANVPLAIFPSVGPAARIKLKPVDWFEFRYGIYDGDPSDGGKNRHNLDYRLSEKQGFTHLWEATFYPHVRFKEKDLPSAIKFGSWIHTQELPDVLKKDEVDEPLTHSKDYGFYGVIDQMLFREQPDQDQGLSTFFQLGGSPDDRSSVDFYFGTGLHYQGLIPKRDQDIVGVAVANAFIGKDSRKARDLEIQNFDASISDPTSMPGKLLSHESAFELTYRIQVHERLAVQPDYQLVVHPAGEDNVNPAHVFILRFEVTF